MTAIAHDQRESILDSLSEIDELRRRLTTPNPNYLRMFGDACRPEIRSTATRADAHDVFGDD